MCGKNVGRLTTRILMTLGCLLCLVACPGWYDLGEKACRSDAQCATGYRCVLNGKEGTCQPSEGNITEPTPTETIPGDEAVRPEETTRDAGKEPTLPEEPTAPEPPPEPPPTETTPEPDIDPNLLVQGLKSTPPPLAKDHPCSTKSKGDADTKKRCEFGLPNRLVGLLGSMHPGIIKHIVPHTSGQLHLFVTTDSLGMLKVWDVTQAGKTPPGGNPYAPQGKLLASTTAHQGAIRAIDVYGNHILTVGTDNFVRYWKLPTQATTAPWKPLDAKRLNPQGKSALYTHIKFNRHTPSSKGFFLADTLGKVTYREISGQTLGPLSSSWNPHGTLRLTGLIVRNATQLITSGGTEIKLWDISNPTKPSESAKAQQGQATPPNITGIALAPGGLGVPGGGGKRVYPLLSVAHKSGQDGSWALWYIENNQFRKQKEEAIDGAGPLLPPAFHPTNKAALIATNKQSQNQQKYYLFSLTGAVGASSITQYAPKGQNTLLIPKGYFNGQPIAYHPNGNPGISTIAFGQNRNLLFNQNLTSTPPTQTSTPLAGYGVSHSNLQYGVSINRHLPLIATFGVDGKVGIWNLHTQQHLKFIEPSSGSGLKYSYAAWSADGQALFIGINQEGTPKTHSIFRQSFTYKGDIFTDTSKEIHDFSGSKDQPSSITYFIPHPNEPSFFAFGTFAGNVFVGEWKNKTLTLHHTKDSGFSSPEGKNILSLDFSDNGQQLAINTNNKGPRVERAFVWNWNDKANNMPSEYMSPHESLVFTTRFWPSHNNYFWVLNQTNTENDGLPAPLGLWKLSGTKATLSSSTSKSKHLTCKDKNDKTIHCTMSNVQIAPNGRWMVTSDTVGNNHFWKLPETPGTTVKLESVGSVTSPFMPWAHNAPRLSRSWNIMVTPVGDPGKSGSGLVWAVASEKPDYAE